VVSEYLSDNLVGLLGTRKKGDLRARSPPNPGRVRRNGKLKKAQHSGEKDVLKHGPRGEEENRTPGLAESAALQHSWKIVRQMKNKSHGQPRGSLEKNGSKNKIKGHEKKK